MYTQAEIEAALEQVVRSGIRRGTDSLGVPRQEMTFQDVQEAAAGLFLLQPEAPYYVVSLGAQRLRGAVQEQAARVTSLLDAVSAVARDVLPVEDVSTLSNAQVALKEISRAAGSRTSGLLDVTRLASYLRFQDNIDRFLKGPGSSIRSGGVLVQTPQQARGALPGLLSACVEGHATLVDRVRELATAMDDYAALNLPSSVAEGVMTRAQAIVASRADSLGAMTSDERLAAMRGVVLDLLAVKTAVRTFGRFSGVTTFRPLLGAAAPYGDANHAGEAAALLSVTSGPWAIYESNARCTVAVDGEVPFDTYLPLSSVAILNGTLPEGDDGYSTGYVIGDGSLPLPSTGSTTPLNNEFVVSLGGTVYTIPLTVSASATSGYLDGSTVLGSLSPTALSGQAILLLVDGVPFSITFSVPGPANPTAICAEINAFFDAPIASVNGGGRLRLQSTKRGPASVVQFIGGSAGPTLGLSPDGPHAGAPPQRRTATQICSDLNTYLPYTLLAETYLSPQRFSGQGSVSSGTGTATITFPPLTDLTLLGVVAGDGVFVQSGGDGGVRYLVTAVVDGQHLTVSGPSPGFVFSPGAAVDMLIGPALRQIRLRCTSPATQVPAETKVQLLGPTDAAKNAYNTLGFFPNLTVSCAPTPPEVVVQSLRATGKLLADVAYTEGVSSAARTTKYDPFLVTFYALTGSAIFTFSGSHAVFTLADPSALQVGDKVVLRGTPASVGTVTGVTDNSASVLFPAVGTTGTYAFDAGPSVSPQRYDSLLVQAGANSGRYLVAGLGDTPLDVRLQAALRETVVDGGNVTLSVSLQRAQVRVTGRSTTDSASLEVTGPGGAFFPAGRVVGKSRFVRFERTPVGTQPGDMLESYPTDYANPSFVSEVANVELSNKLLELTAPLPFGTSLLFGEKPPPFTRVRARRGFDYGSFQARLVNWLALPVNAARYFPELGRLINPLLTSTNPTSVQVGTVQSYLAPLQEALSVAGEGTLEFALREYTAPALSEVDALIRTFREKGSDRALDLLLRGRFQSFFGLTADESSYGGNAQAAMREVARQDLSLRKGNRTEAVQSREISSTTSPDYEFGQDDIEEGVSPEAPGDFSTPDDLS